MFPEFNILLYMYTVYFSAFNDNTQLHIFSVHYLLIVVNLIWIPNKYCDVLHMKSILRFTFHEAFLRPSHWFVFLETKRITVSEYSCKLLLQWKIAFLLKTNCLRLYFYFTLWKNPAASKGVSKYMAQEWKSFVQKNCSDINL